MKQGEVSKLRFWPNGWWVACLWFWPIRFLLHIWGRHQISEKNILWTCKKLRKNLIRNGFEYLSHSLISSHLQKKSSLDLGESKWIRTYFKLRSFVLWKTRSNIIIRNLDILIEDMEWLIFKFRYLLILSLFFIYK